MPQRGRAPLPSPASVRRPRRDRLSAEIFGQLRAATLSDTGRSTLALHGRIYGARLDRDAEAAGRWMLGHLPEIQRRLEHLLRARR